MKLFAPAKINLYLKVMGKRPDGYHELRTIMLPVSFGDEICIEQSPEGITLEASGCNCKDEDNLAYKAAQLFFEKTGVTSGVSIVINKQIPVGSGLGGGSSDGACVLMGMNSLFQAGLAEDELLALASRLGADCPFFIYKRPLLLGSRGDVMISEVYIKDRSYLLVIPPFGISTKRIFSELKSPLTKGVDRITIDNNTGDAITPEQVLENDLEAVAFSIYPELQVIKKDLLEAGALGVLMSGSGSTIFGVFEDNKEMCFGMSRLKRHDGYYYLPTTTLRGERYGDYGGKGISGKG